MREPRKGGAGLRPIEHPADRRGDGFRDPQPTVTFADALERLPFDDLLAVADAASPARVDEALTTDPLARSLEAWEKFRNPHARSS